MHAIIISFKCLLYIIILIYNNGYNHIRLGAGSMVDMNPGPIKVFVLTGTQIPLVPNLNPSNI